MLSRFDLREYRFLRHLSLRDVARYCDVSHELIGKVENGEVSVTKYNHDQIVQGINRASQAMVDGTFDALKEIESQKIKKKRLKKKKKKVPKIQQLRSLLQERLQRLIQASKGGISAMDKT